jgi:fatty acid desaturase
VSAADAWAGPRDQEKRSAIARLHRVDLRWNAIALFFVGLWILTGWLVARFPLWPLRVAGYFVIGAAVHALAILMHEAIHGNFFRRAGLDRWAGFLLGAPALFSATAYKTVHALHHRHNRGSQDPDEFTNLTRRPRLLSAAFYCWGLFGLAAYLIHVPVMALVRGNRRQRRTVLLEYAFLLAIYGGVVAGIHRLGRLDLLLHLWVIPIAVAALLGNVRGWAEHSMTPPGHPLTQTRTVTSNRLVSLLMCNLNYHLEHHLYPGVPWYHLPRVHRLIQEDLAGTGSVVYRSYLRFLWDAIRTGVHGVARESLSSRGQTII